MVKRGLKPVYQTLRGVVRTQVGPHGRDQSPFTFITAGFRVEALRTPRNAGFADAHTGTHHARDRSVGSRCGDGNMPFHGSSHAFPFPDRI